MDFLLFPDIPVKIDSLLDDINTPLAISEIHELVKKLNDNRISDEEWISCKNKIQLYGNLMGLFSKSQSELAYSSKKDLNKNQIEKIENLIKQRNLARQNGNFKLADEIRKKQEVTFY